MTDVECIHGLQPEWCGMCKHPPTKSRSTRKVTVGDVAAQVAAGDYVVLNRRDQIASDWDGSNSPTGRWVDKVRVPSGHIAYMAHGFGKPRAFRTLKQAKAHLNAELRTERTS